METESQINERINWYRNLRCYHFIKRLYSEAILYWQSPLSIPGLKKYQRYELSVALHYFMKKIRGGKKFDDFISQLKPSDVLINLIQVYVNHINSSKDKLEIICRFEELKTINEPEIKKIIYGRSA